MNSNMDVLKVETKVEKTKAENPNQHILEYLLEYSTSSDPQFAVLVKGPWGCGKTYFIQQFIEEYKKREKSEKQKILHVSLFGVDSQDSFYQKVFEAYFPFAKSKSAKVISGVTRIASHVFLGSDTKADLTAFGEILDSGVLIFDDLERSEMNPNLLFGLLNGYVEHNKCPVIIVGDESKFDRKQEKVTDKYTHIKEKIVGREFTITPHLEGFLTNYFNNTPKDKEELKIFLDDRRALIEDLFKKSGVPNLRILTIALDRFSSLFELAQSVPGYSEPEPAKYITEAMLEFWFALCFEIVSGNLEEKDYEILDNNDKEFQDGLMPNYLYHDSVPKTKRKPFDVAMRKYFSEYSTYYIAPSIMYRLLRGSHFTDDEFYQAIRQGDFVEFRLKKAPIQLFLREKPLRQLQDDELVKQIDELNEALNRSAFRHPMDYLLAANMLLLFKEWEMIPDTYDDIVKRCEQGIDASEMDDEYALSFNFQPGFHDSWRGVGFEFKDKPAFKSISAHLNRYCAELTIARLTENGKEVLAAMGEGFESYFELLEKQMTESTKLRHHGIHRYMSPQDSYQAIKTWTNKDLNQYYFFIKDMADYSSKQRRDEIDYWKTLYALLLKHDLSLPTKKMSSVIIAEIAQELGRFTQPNDKQK